MQGFIILAIIGTEKLIVTEFDGRTERRTEILTPISHPTMRYEDIWKRITTRYQGLDLD